MEYRCAALWPWATGWVTDSARTRWHTPPSGQDNQCWVKPHPWSSASCREQLSDKDRETTETTGEAVNYWARGLLRHNRVHSYVCVLALTHSCSVHITSIHMGNNKISLLENEMCCIFMAGAPCMLTAWGEEQNQLSLHAPTIFLSFFLGFAWCKN